MLRFSHLTNGLGADSTTRPQTWALARATFAIGVLALTCGLSCPATAQAPDVGPGNVPQTAPSPASPVETDPGKAPTTSPSLSPPSEVGSTTSVRTMRGRKGGDRGRHGRPKLQSVVVPPRVVMVFPPDVSSHITGGVPSYVGTISLDIQEARVELTGYYSPIFFIGSLPSIRRANTEGTLTSSDITSPFDVTAKLQKIMNSTLYDMALVSSIDDYQFDAASRQVSIVMSIRLIDFLDTGRSRTASESFPFATKPTAIPSSTSERILATQAIRDLTERLMSEVLPSTRPSMSPVLRRN